MVKNIRNTIYKMKLSTNSSTRIIEEEAGVTRFGTVVFSIYAISNIFVLRDLKNVCRVTYDSTNQDAFVAHMDKKQVKFQCNEQGMYIYNPDDRYLEAVNK